MKNSYFGLQYCIGYHPTMTFDILPVHRAHIELQHMI